MQYPGGISPRVNSLALRRGEDPMITITSQEITSAAEAAGSLGGFVKTAAVDSCNNNERMPIGTVLVWHGEKKGRSAAVVAYNREGRALGALVDASQGADAFVDDCNPADVELGARLEGPNRFGYEWVGGDLPLRWGTLLLPLLALADDRLQTSASDQLQAQMVAKQAYERVLAEVWLTHPERTPYQWDFRGTAEEEIAAYIRGEAHLGAPMHLFAPGFRATVGTIRVGHTPAQAA